jgi:hypothetical protein
VDKPIKEPKVSVKPRNDLKIIQPAPYKNVQAQVTPALKTAAKVPGIGSSDPRYRIATQHEGSVKEKSVVQNALVPGSHPSHSDTVEKPNVSHDRPHHHIYSNTSSNEKDEILAAIPADIKNYTEPGEDLDWTKVSDPAERKRLQGIIGSRKYRERRLAAKGKLCSGGNYPGAAGEGSYLTPGYGPQRPYGYSRPKTPQPLPTNATPAKFKDHAASAPANFLHKPLGVLPGPSVPPSADRSSSRHSLPITGSGLNSVVYRGLDEQPRDYGSHGRSAKTIERVGDVALRELSEVRAIISGDRYNEPAKNGDQGSYENFFQSPIDSVTPQESRSRHENSSAGFADDSHQPSLTSHSPASTLMYDSDDGYQEPEDERQPWEPNAGDTAYFQLDKPLKTAFNMFARSAHDAHRFPAQTRKNVVETYHLYIRQVWNLLLERDKYAWRSLSAAHGCFPAAELSVRGQRNLESQGFLSKFLPHVEPCTEGASSIPAAGNR